MGPAIQNCKAVCVYSATQGSCQKSMRAWPLAVLRKVAPLYLAIPKSQIFARRRSRSSSTFCGARGGKGGQAGAPQWCWRPLLTGGAAAEQCGGAKSYGTGERRKRQEP